MDIPVRSADDKLFLFGSGDFSVSAKIKLGLNESLRNRTWHKVEVSRQSQVTRLFVDGLEQQKPLREVAEAILSELGIQIALGFTIGFAILCFWG